MMLRLRRYVITSVAKETKSVKLIGLSALDLREMNIKTNGRCEIWNSARGKRS